MTVKWVEGFELDYRPEHAGRKYAIASGGSTTAGAGRIFGVAQTIGASGLNRRTPSFGLSNTWVFGFGMFVPANYTVGTAGLYLLTGTTEQVSLRPVNTAGSFNLQLSRNGTQIAITTNNFAYGVWHFFELKVTVDPTTGSYELRWNEGAVLSGSGVNTAANATAGADVFEFNFPVAAQNVRIDDFYLLDTGGSAPTNDFLGDVTVEGILPNADGATTTWSVNSGTHFSKLDDAANVAPSDGTDIINSNTNGNRDLLGMTDLTQLNGTIYAVMMTHQAAMNAAGSRVLEHKYRDPGTTVVAGSQYTVASTTYQGFTMLWEKNPFSSSAWANSDIDNGQFGVEVIS